MKQLLKSARLSEDERLALAGLCDGPLSADKLTKQLGLSHWVQTNRAIGRAGKKVYNVSSARSVVRSWKLEGRPDRWYHVVAPGRRSDVDGEFYWEIRPQIRKAIVELGWYASVESQGKSGRLDCEPRFEGAEVLRLSVSRERDPVLRVQCLREKGFRCHICDINLGETYGELGKNLIHVHHIRPLAGGDRPRITNPEDLIPVCPNCHSIIHRGGRLLTPEQVRAAMKKK